MSDTKDTNPPMDNPKDRIGSNKMLAGCRGHETGKRIRPAKGAGLGVDILRGGRVLHSAAQCAIHAGERKRGDEILSGVMFRHELQ